MVLYFCKIFKSIINSYIKNKEILLIILNEIKVLSSLFIYKIKIMYLIFYNTLIFITMHEIFNEKVY